MVFSSSFAPEWCNEATTLAELTAMFVSPGGAGLSGPTAGVCGMDQRLLNPVGLRWVRVIRIARWIAGVVPERGCAGRRAAFAREE